MLSLRTVPTTCDGFVAQRMSRFENHFSRARECPKTSSMQLRAFSVIAAAGIAAVACVPTPAPPSPTAPTAAPPTAPPATAAPTNAPTTVPPTTATPTTVTPTTVPTCSAYQQTTPSSQVADPFNLTIKTMGTADCYRSEITAAVTRWESIITTGFTNGTYSLPTDYCWVTRPAATVPIDDLVVEIEIGYVDGKIGGTLGYGGFCTYVAGPRPIYGRLMLDELDVAALRASGELVDTITHEIGHVLGIGTNWSFLTNQLIADKTTPTPTYTGTHGVAAWHALGGTGNVPVHPDDPSTTADDGTALGHWDETTFGDELMTGRLTGLVRPLSSLTIASLRDLGYTVDMTKAEAYTWPPPLTLWKGLSRAANEPATHLEPLAPAGAATEAN